MTWSFQIRHNKGTKRSPPLCQIWWLTALFNFYFFTIDSVHRQIKDKTSFNMSLNWSCEWNGDGKSGAFKRKTKSIQLSWKEFWRAWLIINKPGFGDVLLVGGHIYFPLGGLCSWIFFNVKVQSFCITALCGCRLQK